MATLITCLKKENEHGLVDSIINVGQLVPVGVVKALRLVAKQDSLVDICLLVRADYDQLILKSVKKYLDSKESEVVEKLFNKAKIKVKGELEEEYVGLISCFFGNNEIIMSFGHLSYIITIGKLGWERTHEDSEYDGREYYLSKEEIAAILDM